MTVNPGFGGQSFIRSTVDGIAECRRLIGERPIRLEVDGGITPETAALAAAAGADVFVAGSSVFRGGAGAYRDNIAAIRNAVCPAA
jgi:ribulose-phosphate 3-epimerase